VRLVILGRTPPGGGARVPPYRRRRRLPWAVVVAVLAVAAVATWTVVLTKANGPSAATACPPPTAGALHGQVVDPASLDRVAPVPPAATKVRVLNAGGQRGQANLVAAQLADLGFPEAAPPGNDPLHPNGKMECVGQLRFGPAGQGAARTLTLVLPCTELVRDDRGDDTVDIAVGTGFRDVNPPRAVRNALDQIANGAASGGDGSANADPNDPNASTAATPGVDPTVLETARNAAC
jgi:LytR cell envelope-related transcriptional attenuator